MARKKRSPEKQALIKELLAQYEPETAKDAHEVIKDLMRK